nr:hypothetical protein [Neobacillus sp. 179.-C4.2 HS]
MIISIYFGRYFPYALIGIAIAIGTSFAITYILVKKQELANHKM